MKSDLDTRRAEPLPYIRMAKRCIASVLGLVLASLFAMGGVVCAGMPDPTSCCCAIAGTPLASPLARMCCETACHEKTNDTPSTPSQAAVQGITPSLPSTPVCVESSEQTLNTLIPVTLKSADTAVAHQDPPVLYIRKQTFLI